jgi:hypothetical protein
MLVFFGLSCAQRTQLNYDSPGGSVISRERRVQSWTVNGERVETKFLEPEPGCYALGVKYKETFDGMRQPGVVALVGSGQLEMMELAAQLMAAGFHKEYESGSVAFALQVRSNHTYWVTSTFTGDEFIGRIVETNELGERVGAIEPARTAQELSDCVHRNVRAAAAKYQ